MLIFLCERKTVFSAGPAFVFSNDYFRGFRKEQMPMPVVLLEEAMMTDPGVSAETEIAM